MQKAINGSRPTEIAVARAELKEARAQLAGASTKLNNTIIRAPFAGIITRSFARAGDFITPNTSASDTVGLPLLVSPNFRAEEKLRRNTRSNYF